MPTCECTKIVNCIVDKELPGADWHAWWFEKLENESRKKTTSFSSYSICPECISQEIKPPP